MSEFKRAFNVEYGTSAQLVNVTYKALDAALSMHDGVASLNLPPCDVRRAQLLGDPNFGTVKYVVVQDAEGERKVVSTEELKMRLDISNPTISQFLRWRDLPKPTGDAVQHMQCLMHIPKTANVLQMQIADHGSLATVLSHLVLQDASQQLVVCEYDLQQCAMVDELSKKDAKLQKVKVCNVAISSVRLALRKGVLVEIHDKTELLSDDKFIPAMGYEQWTKFYQFNPDTLVISGTDHFYRLLQDQGPFMLARFHMILLTHDYSRDPETRQIYISSILESLGFVVIDTHFHPKGPGFYQVWEQKQACVIHR